MAECIFRWFKASYVFLHALILLFVVPTASSAFDDRATHPKMTDLAVLSSTLDKTLRDDLGIADGINTFLRSASGGPQLIRLWLQVGSTLEDDPVCRASNHFHNPLRPFTASGVTDLPWWVRARCAFSEYSEVQRDLGDSVHCPHD